MVVTVNAGINVTRFPPSGGTGSHVAFQNFRGISLYPSQIRTVPPQSRIRYGLDICIFASLLAPACICR